METWRQYIFLSLLIFSSNMLLAAEQEAPEIYQPDETRILLSEASIDAHDFEIGLYGGIISVQDFGSNSLYGAKLIYHISESYFTEINLAKSSIQETSFEKLTHISLGQGDDRDYTYYDIGMGFNLFQGESFFGKNRAFNSSFFITASIGSTQFLADSFHTLSFGFGYKVIFTDWLSVNLGAKDHLFRSDIFAEKDELFHSIELHSGINIIF